MDFSSSDLSSLGSNCTARMQAESCGFIDLSTKLGAARVTKNREGEVLGSREP